jgi:hypothetical protein
VSETRYWKARADELERVVSDLRQRIRAIVSHLPADELSILTGPAVATRLRDHDLWYAELLRTLDVSFMTPSTVRHELETLWERSAHLEKI